MKVQLAWHEGQSKKNALKSLMTPKAMKSTSLTCGAPPTESSPTQVSQLPPESRTTVLAGMYHTAAGAMNVLRHAESANHTASGRSNVRSVCSLSTTCS